MFREDKTTQMAAQFLVLANGRLSRPALMGLLYAADRRMLAEYGAPITYDQWLWAEHGPVLAATLALMGAPNQKSHWSTHISQDGDFASLVADPGDDDLSRAEDAIIEETFHEWKNEVMRHDANAARRLPERGDVGLSARPITYEDILRASGLSAEDTATILERIELQDVMYDVLGVV